MPAAIGIGIGVSYWNQGDSGPPPVVVNGAYFGPRFFGGRYFGRRFFG